jgi:hypothetical protein
MTEIISKTGSTGLKNKVSKKDLLDIIAKQQEQINELSSAVSFLVPQKKDWTQYFNYNLTIDKKKYSKETIKRLKSLKPISNDDLLNLYSKFNLDYITEGYFGIIKLIIREFYSSIIFSSETQKFYYNIKTNQQNQIVYIEENGTYLFRVIFNILIEKYNILSKNIDTRLIKDKLKYYNSGIMCTSFEYLISDFNNNNFEYFNKFCISEIINYVFLVQTLNDTQNFNEDLETNIKDINDLIYFKDIPELGDEDICYESKFENYTKLHFLGRTNI